MSWLPSDADIILLAPPRPPPTYYGDPSSSLHTSYDYEEVQATLRSIQEEKASLRAYVEAEHGAIHDVVQQKQNELCGMISS